MKLDHISSYRDDRGNTINYSGCIDTNVQILFSGKNNTLSIHPKARIKYLRVRFDCNNARVSIGDSLSTGAIRLNARAGQDATILIGAGVSMTSSVYISAVEGRKIEISKDAMIASGVQIRSDDGHPIFDVKTGKRINLANDIFIDEHVWVGANATLLGGAEIGSGSVIGFGAIVKSRIPNNCIAAGIPARVIRKDIAWERPHLSLSKPFYKLDASSISINEEYWRETNED